MGDPNVGNQPSDSGYTGNRKFIIPPTSGQGEIYVSICNGDEQDLDPDLFNAIKNLIIVLQKNVSKPGSNVEGLISDFNIARQCRPDALRLDVKLNNLASKNSEA